MSHFKAWSVILGLEKKDWLNLCDDSEKKANV